MAPEDFGRWLLAIAKHLKAFNQSPQAAALFATRRSASDSELLLRVRGYGQVSGRKLEALALDLAIPPQELPAVLARLEGTGLISAAWTRDGELDRVDEKIFTEREVYRATAKLFHEANPRPAERALVPMLDLLSRLPLTEQEVVARLTDDGLSEEVVRRGLEVQEAFGLLRRQFVGDFGVPFLFNEYLWGHKIEKVGPLLAKLGVPEKDGLLAIMEEVRGAQGRSLDQLSSAPPHIVALAANTGILDTTTIVTATGDKKIFTFSPHFYGYRTGSQSLTIADDADQVKLFVASISYGVHHSADARLNAPDLFVRRLLRDHQAGDASPILRDYVLLEKQGIVDIRETSPGRGTFFLRKQDVVERALEVITNGSLFDEVSPGGSRVRGAQQGFYSPEETRLRTRFGEQAGNTKRFDQDLLSAVREAAQGGYW